MKYMTKKEAIEKGLIKPQNGDLLKKLQIILKTELFLYEDYRKTKNEEDLQDECKELIKTLHRQTCTDLLEAIRCAAIQPS